MEKDPRVITPEEYRRTEFIRKLRIYFPEISIFKWLFVRLFGKKRFGYSGHIGEWTWLWYEFRGIDYITVTLAFPRKPML